MKTSVLFLTALLVAGCTTRTVEYQGVRYVHRSFGVKQSIGKLSIFAPNGTSVSIEGYSNDQAEFAGAVVEKAVSAAMKGVAP